MADEYEVTARIRGLDEISVRRVPLDLLLVADAIAIVALCVLVAFAREQGDMAPLAQRVVASRCYFARALPRRVCRGPFRTPSGPEEYGGMAGRLIRQMRVGPRDRESFVQGQAIGCGACGLRTWGVRPGRAANDRERRRSRVPHLLLGLWHAVCVEAPWRGARGEDLAVRTALTTGRDRGPYRRVASGELPQNARLERLPAVAIGHRLPGGMTPAESLKGASDELPGRAWQGRLSSGSGRRSCARGSRLLATAWSPGSTGPPTLLPIRPGNGRF